MIASRLSSRWLSCLACPVLVCFLSACSAPDNEASGPPAFTGTGTLSPGGSNAGAPSTGGNGSMPSGSTPAGTTNPPVSGTPPATNESPQTGQVPVTGNMTNNSANGGAAGAGSGTGGAGTMGSTPMGNAGAAPMGAAGAAPMGAAGAAGTPVQNPPAPPVMLPTPPGQAFFFDDFEGGAAGTQPAAWNRWINYTTVAGNALGNPQFALLDDTESFRGNQSVHFHTEGATQPAMLTMRLPAGMNRIYIRAFVKTRIAVGGVAADSVSNHESMIGLRAVPNDGNDEIRFGGAKGALGFNAVGPGRNDAVAPLQAQWGSGPGLTPNMWQCVEIAFLNDGTPRATASVGGNVVRDVTSPAGWHIPVSQTWLNGLYNEVFIGWQSFSPQPANDVWMDDVVLSQQPIGCQ